MQLKHDGLSRRGNYLVGFYVLFVSEAERRFLSGDVKRITQASAHESRQTAPFCHTEKYRKNFVELIVLISFVATHLAMA